MREVGVRVLVLVGVVGNEQVGAGTEAWAGAKEEKSEKIW